VAKTRFIGKLHTRWSRGGAATLRFDLELIEFSWEMKINYIEILWF